MPHFPSLLVGSTFSVVSFLAVHQQLSHRSQLARRWRLRETTTNFVRSEYKSFMKNSDIGKQLQSCESPSTYWNRGVTYIEETLRKVGR